MILGQMPRMILIGLLSVLAGTTAPLSMGAADNGVVPHEAMTSLSAIAVRDGHVPIIVGLRVPPPGFRPEGLLNSTEIRKQRDAILSTRNSLLESLAGHEIEVYAIYDSLPITALKADADALHALAKSPYVRSIQEDKALQTHADDLANEKKEDVSPAKKPADAD
ncbi:MAG: hypothetical protein ACYC9M_06125 [Desulfobulbaceae bacterium]